MRTGSIIGPVFGLSFMLMAGYMAMKYANMQVGQLSDWLTAIGAFWWLSVVVTLPWNTHFKAKEILDEADISRKKGINVEEGEISYAKRISKRYLLVALGLHLFSAAAFFGLAVSGVSEAVGYTAAGLALLLTGLRPAVRFHEYLTARLGNMKEAIRYPREDVLLIESRLSQTESELARLSAMLNSEDASSFISKKEKESAYLKSELHRLKTDLANFKVENDSAHQQIERKSENSLTRISEDAKFLGQVRDILRFIKDA